MELRKASREPVRMVGVSAKHTGWVSSELRTRRSTTSLSSLLALLVESAACRCGQIM